MEMRMMRKLLAWYGMHRSGIPVRLLAPLLLALHAGGSAAAEIIQVSPNSQVHTIAQAAATAKDGDTVVIAPGDYYGDVATWTQDRLTIRAGAGGRVRLIAAGSQAEGKGIWVVTGGKVTIEDIDFRGARAPGHDGAGIRLEKGQLLLRRCGFTDNENGVIAIDGEATLEIENSEFGDNGDGSGATHTLLVGSIRSLKVSGSYFHHARRGSLLTSRARDNLLVSNRFTDESGGQGGEELAFPGGGMVGLIGNIIEQSATTTGPAIIAYGADGYTAPVNALYLASNTIVDDKPEGGIMLQARPGERQVQAYNNLLVGASTLQGGQPAGWRDRVAGIVKGWTKRNGEPAAAAATVEGRFVNNVRVDWTALVLPMRYDYRLTAESGLDGKFVSPPDVEGMNLVPKSEYLHPARTRPLTGTPTMPGALQTTGPARGR
jgi:hypothetical protein